MTTPINFAGEKRMEARHTNEPPREVWVVSDGSGQAEFVSNARESANEHANEAAGGLPEEGPYRLCRYVAEPFASTAPDLVKALQQIARLSKEGEVSAKMQYALGDIASAALVKVGAA